MKHFPHLKFVDVRVPNGPDRWIDGSGMIQEWAGITVPSLCFQPIVERDNPYGVWALEELRIPDGREPSGESLAASFHEPGPDEEWLSRAGIVECSGVPCGKDKRRLCLRKIAPKTRRVLVIEWIDPPIEILKAWTADSADLPNRSVRVEERPIK